MFLRRQFIRYPAAMFIHTATALSISLCSVNNSWAVSLPPGLAQTTWAAESCFRNQLCLKQIHHHCNITALRLTLTSTHFKLVHNELLINSNITPPSEPSFSRQPLQIRTWKLNFVLFLVSSGHGSLNIGSKRMKVKSSPHMTWRHLWGRLYSHWSASRTGLFNL